MGCAFVKAEYRARTELSARVLAEHAQALGLIPITERKEEEMLP